MVFKEYSLLNFDYFFLMATFVIFLLLNTTGMTAYLYIKHTFFSNIKCALDYDEWVHYQGPEH